MNKKKMIIIAAAVLLIVVVAVVLIFVLGGDKEPKEVELVYSEYYFEEAYSNLAVPDDGKGSICKYRVCIKYTGDTTLELIEKNKTELLNNIDEIIRTTKKEDLEKQNGKEKLRGKIQNMVIDVLELDEEIIDDVFLQPFVIQ